MNTSKIVTKTTLTEARTWFLTRIRRTDGENVTYWSLDDAAPEWLRTAVYEAHGDRLPNDWTYEQCANAWHAICDYVREDGNVDDFDTHEHADSMVDLYIRLVFEWAGEFCLSNVFAQAEDDANDMCMYHDKTVAERLGVIQYCAIARITDCMLDAFRSNLRLELEEESC